MAADQKDRVKFAVGTKGSGWEDDEILMAGSDESGAGGGRIIYFKGSGIARASGPIWRHFRELSKGGYNPGTEPVLSDGCPRFEVVLLYALRDFNPLHAAAAFALYRKESEAQGMPLSEQELSELPYVAANHQRFREFIGDWLAGIAEDDGAAGFEVIAKWASAAERAAAREDSLEQKEFLLAVESATVEAKGVPTQKAVRSKLDSAGIGEKDRFTSMRDMMGFDWLPAGKPGPSSRQ